MAYTTKEADRIGKPKGVVDLPFEVVVYGSGGKRGHHKTDLKLWRGETLIEALIYYRLAISIIKIFVADKWAMVIIRGNGRWYNRAVFKDGKVKEEIA